MSTLFLLNISIAYYNELFYNIFYNVYNSNIAVFYYLIQFLYLSIYVEEESFMILPLLLGNAFIINCYQNFDYMSYISNNYPVIMYYSILYFLSGILWSAIKLRITANKENVSNKNIRDYIGHFLLNRRNTLYNWILFWIFSVVETIYNNLIVNILYNTVFYFYLSNCISRDDKDYVYIEERLSESEEDGVEEGDDEEREEDDEEINEDIGEGEEDSENINNDNFEHLNDYENNRYDYLNNTSDEISTDFDDYNYKNRDFSKNL